MSTFPKSTSQSRERISGKDIQHIMGYARAQAFRHFKAIKLTKRRRFEQKGEPAPATIHVFKDDLVEHFAGLSKQAINEALAC